MSLLNTALDGLTDEDFDIYRPECWSSNLHNLGRMRTKERVVALTKGIADIFEASQLKFEASSEIPSVWNGREVRDQWGYWLRNDSAQRLLQPVLARRLDLATRIKAPADHFKHVLFCVRLSHESLGIGLRLSRYATIDVANLLGRAQAQSDGFAQVLGEISADIHLDGEPPTAQTLLGVSRALMSGEREWLDLVCHIPRDEVVTLGDGISATIRNVATSLAPLLNFLLWSEENDHIDVASEISNFAQQTEARTEAIEAERASRVQERAERAEKARDRTSAKVAAEDAWRRMQQSKKRPSQPPERAAPGGEDKPASSSRPTRSRPQRPAAKSKGRPKSTDKGRTADRKPKKSTQRKPRKPAPVFEVGQCCMLTRGLFAGKTGEITGSEKPGYYTVKVGLLEVNVSAYDLGAERG